LQATQDLLLVAPVGEYPRFAAPTVANGSVYVPTFSGEVGVYGLKGRAVQTAGRKSFIQGNWGRQGNFELLVPQGRIVTHYFRNNDDSRMLWHSIRQLSYPTPGRNQQGQHREASPSYKAITRGVVCTEISRQSCVCRRRLRPEAVAQVEELPCLVHP
jgi:hypothetical protein